MYLLVNLTPVIWLAPSRLFTQILFRVGAVLGDMMAVLTEWLSREESIGISKCGLWNEPSR